MKIEKRWENNRSKMISYIVFGAYLFLLTWLVLFKFAFKTTKSNPISLRNKCCVYNTYERGYIQYTDICSGRSLLHCISGEKKMVVGDWSIIFCEPDI